MWRILSERENESRKQAAKKRHRIAEQSYLLAHDGSYQEVAYRRRFYRAYARQMARRGIRVRGLGGAPLFGVFSGGLGATAGEAQRDEVRGVIGTAPSPGDDVVGAEHEIAAAAHARAVALGDHQ
ncbi:MAG TPA: hypothetical protein VK356_03245 [Thermomicrobiales bacterium]|jgi:hypothetical protein|nr:hypothetical protein [Thermomicrobiales bacterium]